MLASELAVKFMMLINNAVIRRLLPVTKLIAAQIISHCHRPVTRTSDTVSWTVHSQ